MKEDLLQSDRQFSMLSASEGIKAAFEQFMADSAVMYREGYAPFIGRSAPNPPTLVAANLKPGEGGCRVPGACES